MTTDFSEKEKEVLVLEIVDACFHCSVDYLLGIEKTSRASIDVSMLNDDQIARLQYFLSSIH